jgi:hypothetical protein
MNGGFLCGYPDLFIYDSSHPGNAGSAEGRGRVAGR